MKHYSFHTFSSLHFHTFSWRSTLTLPQILGFNFVYCQCLPEYNSKHWRYTKGGLCCFLNDTLSYYHCSNLFYLPKSLFFFLFSNTMAAPWLTVHFCRQSMDYHMVVYMSGHKIRKMCNPRPITLHEIHMSPCLFRNLLTPGFSYPTAR